MNIKTLGFALVAASLISGCAGTAETDGEMTSQDTGAVKDIDPAQDTGAVETTNTIDDADAVVAAELDPDAVTCRRIAKAGTRIKVRTCATNAEWKASEENAKHVTEELQRRGTEVFGREGT
ncbi:MAG: hypothetical protein ACR2QX_05730 [Woeseiaceae bacterium]